MFSETVASGETDQRSGRRTHKMDTGELRSKQTRKQINKQINFMSVPMNS